MDVAIVATISEREKKGASRPPLVGRDAFVGLQPCWPQSRTIVFLGRSRSRGSRSRWCLGWVFGVRTFPGATGAPCPRFKTFKTFTIVGTPAPAVNGRSAPRSKSSPQNKNPGAMAGTSSRAPKSSAQTSDPNRKWKRAGHPSKIPPLPVSEGKTAERNKRTPNESATCDTPLDQGPSPDPVSS